MLYFALLKCVSQLRIHVDVVALNESCRINIGCLKPTQPENYYLAGILLLDVYQEVLANNE